MSISTILWLFISILGGVSVGYFQYLYKKSKTTLNFALALFRSASVGVILLLLFNLSLTQSEPYLSKYQLNIIADNSQSIRFLNQDSLLLSSVDYLKNQTAIKERFDVRYYTIGEQLKRSDSIDFSDKLTNLSEAIKAMNEINSQEMVTILLSDGNQNYGTKAHFEADSLSQVVFPVVYGSSISPFDLSIETVQHNPYAFSSNQSEIEVVVHSSENTDRNVILKAIVDNKVVSQNSVSFRDRKSQMVKMIIPPSKPGINRYKVSIESGIKEKSLSNNQFDFDVETIDESSKVAIVSGIVHPDIGVFVKAINALESSSAVVLTPSEFMAQKDQFQTALIYQPNQAFSEIAQWIQRTGFQAAWIIGSETDSKWVNQSQNWFQLDSTTESELYDLAYNPDFNLFTIESFDFSAWPPIEASFGSVAFKVPNTPLFFKKYRGIVLKEDPIWTMFESNGIKGSLIRGENFWRWRAQTYLNTGNFEAFDALIGQVIRSLSNAVNRDQLQLTYRTIYNETDNKEISALWLNDNLENNPDEVLEIQIKNNITGLSESRNMVFQSGRYRISLDDLGEGNYTFNVQVNGILKKEGSFEILNRKVEEHQLSANFEDMNLLATASGGQLFTPEDLEELVQMITKSDRYRPVEKVSQKVVPLLTIWWFLAILSTTIAVEWFVRKYNGLL